MGLLDALKDNHDEVHNKGSLAHDALAGAVAWQAIKAWQDHKSKNAGERTSHATAKKALAGFAAAAVAHLIETRGLDAYDEHKRKKLQEEAEKQLNDAYDEEYDEDDEDE